LQLFEGKQNVEDAVAAYLVGSLTLWVILNAAFPNTIDMSFLPTFFGTQTAPQYTCKYFTTSKEDCKRWDVVFENRLQYTESVHGEVKEWVGSNIARWKKKKPDFFNIEMIPDDFLPRDVYEMEGGAKRRRSNVSLREIVGLVPLSVEEEQQLALFHRNETSRTNRENKNIIEAWKSVAEAIYETRSNNYKSNVIHVQRIFG